MDPVIVIILLLIFGALGYGYHQYRQLNAGPDPTLNPLLSEETLEVAADLYIESHKLKDHFEFSLDMRDNYEREKRRVATEGGIKSLGTAEEIDAEKEKEKEDEHERLGGDDNNAKKSDDNATTTKDKPRVPKSLPTTEIYPSSFYLNNKPLMSILVQRAMWAVKQLHGMELSVQPIKSDPTLPPQAKDLVEDGFSKMNGELEDILCEAERIQPGSGWGGRDHPRNILRQAFDLTIGMDQRRMMAKKLQEEQAKKKAEDEAKKKVDAKAAEEAKKKKQQIEAERAFKELMKEEDKKSDSSSKKKSKKAD